MDEPREVRDSVDQILDVWRTELPEVAGLPLELAKRLAQVHGALESVVAPELDRLGLTKAESDVLARLRSAGPPYRRKPNDLSKALLLSTGGTTNVLHRLSSRELITRTSDAEDRRSSWVQLTPPGVALAEDAVRATTRAQAAVLDRLPAELARDLADKLREVVDLLDVVTVTYPR